MSKGIFLLTFMDLSISPPLTKEDFNMLSNKIKPIVEELDCDFIITDRPVYPIGKHEFKKYLTTLLKMIEDK